jgi:CheY-like chemotaxis protein
MLEHLPSCDLVLLDLRMREMNGVELIQAPGSESDSAGFRSSS